MKAHNLKDAYNAFAPTPLEETEQIESFYINRGENLTKLFSTFAGQPVKVLFAGHRGSGRTTELNYTETTLSDKYTVLNLPVGKFLDSNKVNDSSDIIKAILYALESTPKVRIKLDDSIIEISGFISVSFDYSIKDSKNKLNKTIETIEKQTGKKVLLFIDDIDDHAHAIENILLKEGKMFDDIECSLVLTLPITTIYSPLTNRISEWFNHTEVLPIIAPRNKKGNVNRRGMTQLKELALSRMDERLIDKAALKNAIIHSGGVCRYLVKIIRDSIFRALNSGRDQILKEDTTHTIKTIRDGFGRTIGANDYERLWEIHEKKNLVDVETDIRFIARDFVLEYQDQNRWVDIHPIIKGVGDPNRLGDRKSCLKQDLGWTREL